MLLPLVCMLGIGGHSLGKSPGIATIGKGEIVGEFMLDKRLRTSWRGDTLRNHPKESFCFKHPVNLVVHVSVEGHNKESPGCGRG